MLERLVVSGLGIIDEVTLELSPGFVAVTGETGAGKSLLVESLKLLAGQRAQSEQVRSGDDRLRVEGTFRPTDSIRLASLLDELGVVVDEELTLRREVTSSGRGRAWVNDVSVTTTALQRLAPELLSIHGQHEQHGLAEPAVQRGIVDEYGGYPELLDAVRSAHATWVTAAAEARRLAAARASRRDRLDVVAFQLAEIDGVSPEAGEEETLRQRRDVLRHAVRLVELSRSAVERLGEGERAVVADLARAERELEEMASLGLRVAEGAARLAEARLAVEETLRELQIMAERIGEDPAELEQAESRLYRLDQLMLKYGSPLQSVLDHRDRLLAERQELEQVEDRLSEAEAEARQLLADYAAAAEALDRARHEAGEQLLTAVAEVLTRLNMAGTRLEMSWQARPDPASPLQRDGVAVAFDQDGVETCELLIAPNPGEELRPMAKIASGGELSRVHLALRTALRGRRGGAGLTLLFDEVDSGLGGATAAALAGLLADLASVDQVLVVTHLPQVAARATAHFRVEKVVERKRAVTRVVRLSRREREDEVARMLSGETTQASARAHARALLGSS